MVSPMLQTRKVSERLGHLLKLTWPVNGRAGIPKYVLLASGVQDLDSYATSLLSRDRVMLMQEEGSSSGRNWGLLRDAVRTDNVAALWGVEIARALSGRKYLVMP